ncbi:MAG: hypothetical protein R3B68_05350 [Phycisphaerales bacterium]
MNHWIIIAWSLVAIAAAVAAWAVFSDRAKGRRRCPGGWRRVLWVLPVRAGCWYDMGGAIELPATCPECGRTWRREASLRRTRVRYGRLGLAGACVAAAYLASLMPRVDKYGWWSAAPTWALVSFAPMEEFARGSLGCRVSWNMLPGSTAELMEPKWDRPYAPWETAILKWRLERAVDRVRDEFPGRDAAFIPLAKYQSEEWWGWEGEPFGGDDLVWLNSQWRWAINQLGILASSGSFGSRLRESAGLMILGSTVDRIRAWDESLTVVDPTASRDSVTQVAGTDSEGVELVLAAFNARRIVEEPLRVSGILANSEGPPTALQPPSVVPSRETEVLVSIVRRVCRWDVPDPRTPLRMPNPRVAVIRSTVMLSTNEESARRVVGMLTAMDEAVASHADYAEVLATDREGQVAAVFYAPGLLISRYQAINDVHGPVAVAVHKVRMALCESSGRWDSSSVFEVGPLIVVFGSSADIDVASAEVARLRAEAELAPSNP